MDIKTKADEVVRNSVSDAWWECIDTQRKMELTKRFLGVSPFFDLIPSKSNWENAFGELLRRRTQRALDLAERKAQKKIFRAIEVLSEFGYGVIPPSK